MISGNIGDKEKKMIMAVAVVFVLAFIAPGFVGNYAAQYLRQKTSERNKLENKIETLQKDIDSIEDRKIILERYVKRYESLVDRRLIFLPDEVNLVKEMKKIRRRGKYQGIDFSFLDKVLLDSEDTLYTENSTIKINVAPLRLEMGMLHDMDMFMFMESLSEQIPNVAFPVKCAMQLTQTDFAVVDRENMRGECQINWYSVEDPDSNTNVENSGTEETALADG